METRYLLVSVVEKNNFAKGWSCRVWRWCEPWSWMSIL